MEGGWWIPPWVFDRSQYFETISLFSFTRKLMICFKPKYIWKVMMMLAACDAIKDGRHLEFYP